ncbi:MAG: EAL domain-containing protein, partial [Candidatus Fimimonas sp.]
VFVVIYLVTRRIQREKEFFNMETTDTKLQCPNRVGFEKSAKKVLERNSNSNFFVVVAQLRHYKHILENFGDVETSHLLMHLRAACSKLVNLEEVYGHGEEGDFLLLMHAKNRDALVERLKILAYTAAQYKGAHKFDILLRFGIYEIDRTETVTVSQMIDFANEANNSISQATAQNANMQFNFYNNELRKIRLLNEDMELRMEGALRDGEFQLFYQPKYNLRTKRQDGCEALVRWYDPKTQKFNPPALFMQLFETNGFIVKLDKYVYAKVCEYISYTIAHGGTVYPVSVNVSRITAVQPDFVDYYYKTKRKYGISDGLIMIEFTESFAYENYEILRTIVDDLHDKGFKCSIDDFGCGYSSYRILKSLPMDEIKLDKFFLEKSESESRDLAIFQSIIQLAKNLGMKVTQEGVETKEDLLRLIDLGCDVIQGYYYSHPLPLSDYINFVATSREHNIT